MASRLTTAASAATWSRRTARSKSTAGGCRGGRRRRSASPRLGSPMRRAPSCLPEAGPSALLGVRYNERDGLLAMGVNVDGDGASYDDSYTRRSAQPFPVSEQRYAAPPPAWDYRY